jgi:hypothetical protein
MTYVFNVRGAISAAAVDPTSDADYAAGMVDQALENATTALRRVTKRAHTVGGDRGQVSDCPDTSRRY